jgi:hypothetical protein
MQKRCFQFIPIIKRFDHIAKIVIIRLDISEIDEQSR